MKGYTKNTLMCMILLFCFTFAVAGEGKDKKKAKTTVASQSGGKCFDESTRVINLGAGLGSGNYYSAYRNHGYIYKSSPAFSFSYEQPLAKNVGPGLLGLGVYLGYQTASSTYNYYWDKNGYKDYYYYRNRWNNFMVAARAAYHPDVLNFGKGEVYFGAMAGLRFQSYHYETNNPDPNSDIYRLSSRSVFPTLSVFAGGRWYFTDNLGLFAELGYGISYLTGGLSFKF
ncbi:MAG: hypothetical protein ACJ76F_10870 [Bacteroidia bacterium]